MTTTPKAVALTARYGHGPVIIVAGLLMPLLAQLAAIFVGIMLFASGFLLPTPSPAAELVAARVSPKVRRPHCICFVTILAAVLPVPLAGSFGTATAGQV